MSILFGKTVKRKDTTLYPVKQLFTITILLVNFLFTMSQHTNIALNDYKKIGPVYFVNNVDKGQSVLSVMEWKEGTNKTVYHYFLQLNDLQTAAMIKRKEIAIIDDKPMEHEQLIGKMGNVFWVLTDSLVGYNETSLEINTTESNIAEKNSFMKNNFSRLHNSYLLDEAAQVMYINAENGERYKLYPSDLLMKPDDTNSDPAPDDFIYEYAADYKLYGQYNFKYALSCLDTSNQLLYILGSPGETRQVLDYMGVSIYPDRVETRQVTIIPYRPDGEKFDYAKNKPLTGEKKYIKGAFLQNKCYTTAWKGSNSERIILYNTNNSPKATICIALIDKSGKEKWSLQTGMATADFLDYLISPSSLLIWSGKKTCILSCVNLTDGKSSSYTYLQ